MKAILALALLVLTAPLANAHPNDPTEITGATVRCVDNREPSLDMYFHFNHEEKRAWYGPSLEQGWEITVTNYLQARCPGCYRVTGSVFDSQLEMVLNGKFGTDESTLNLMNTFPGQPTAERVEFECKAIPAKK